MTCENLRMLYQTNDTLLEEPVKTQKMYSFYQKFIYFFVISSELFTIFLKKQWQKTESVVCSHHQKTTHSLACLANLSLATSFDKQVHCARIKSGSQNKRLKFNKKLVSFVWNFRYTHPDATQQELTQYFRQTHDTVNFITSDNTSPKI